MKLRKMIFLAMYASLMVVADYALAFIPNVQVIMLLVIALAVSVKPMESIIAVSVYVLADNLLGYGLSWYTIPMLIGWNLVAVSAYFISGLVPVAHNDKIYALASIVFSAWYSVPFAFTTVLLYQVDLWQYLVADLPFMIVLALSSYLTVDLFLTRMHHLIKIGLGEIEFIHERGD
jgi:hypothetical protein